MRYYWGEQILPKPHAIASACMVSTNSFYILKHIKVWCHSETEFLKAILNPKSTLLIYPYVLFELFICLLFPFPSGHPQQGISPLHHVSAALSLLPSILWDVPSCGGKITGVKPEEPCVDFALLWSWNFVCLAFHVCEWISKLQFVFPSASLSIPGETIQMREQFKAHITSINSQ